MAKANNYKINSTSSALARIKLIVDDARAARAKIDHEISEQKKRGYFPSQEKMQKYNESKTLATLTAKQQLSNLKERYAEFAIESTKPFGVVTDNATGLKTLAGLSNGDIRIMESLKYITLTREEIQHYIQFYQDEAHPAMVRALSDYAKNQGFEVHGVENADSKQMIQKFNRAATLAEHMVDLPTDLSSEPLEVRMFADDVMAKYEALFTQEMPQIKLERIAENIEDVEIEPEIKPDGNKADFIFGFNGEEAAEKEQQVMRTAEILDRNHDVIFAKQSERSEQGKNVDAGTD